MYKLKLVAYAQAFPDFVLSSFITSSLVKMLSRTRSRILDMGRTKEGTETTMEVDSIAVEVATEST